MASRFWKYGALGLTIALAGFLGYQLFSGRDAESAVREWGRLAPFPRTARDVTIKVGGSMFTRSFTGFFRDQTENIQSWLETSPGASHCEIAKIMQGASCVLQPGGGAQHAEVAVIRMSRGDRMVIFYVYWS